jgi:hypothetical protein
LFKEKPCLKENRAFFMGINDLGLAVIKMIKINYHRSLAMTPKLESFQY